MRSLAPAISDSERLCFCLFLALVIHGMAIFGIVPVDASLERMSDLDLVWAGDTGPSHSSAQGAGQGSSWPSHPASTSALSRELNAGTQEAYTLEQEYMHQWVERTERQGDKMAQSLEGEIVVHVVMNAQGTVRQIGTGTGRQDLARAARGIVLRSQPHAPFPEALRAHRDQLRISRRWLFGESAGLHVRGLTQP